jgi:VCBS repeat-containing protein
VTITITGTNDKPTITAGLTDAIGAASEDDANPTLSDSGTIAFNDVDLIDVHTASVAAAAGNTLGGTLTLDPVSGETAANETGSVGWTYNVANSATQYLAAGQFATETFTVTINDGHGGTVDQLVTVTITGTNDAPVLNAAASPALLAVAEDAVVPVAVVGTLVSALVNLNPPAGGLDNVTDTDSGAVTGIALTGTNSTNGTWYYSTNNGGTWTAVGAVSNTSALLLAADANTRVYFQGNSNFNGTVSDGITFRAWDQTSGTAGNHVSTAINGGTTAFSTVTDTVSVAVTAVNDNPVAGADVLYASNSTAVTLPTSVLLANDTDVDGIALSVTAISVVSGSLGGAGTVTVNSNGTFTFTTGATGGTVASPTVVNLSYTVSDAAGGSTTGTITLNVVAATTGANTIDLSGVTNYQAAYIDGNSGNDTLSDGGFQSVLLGSSGNDTLNGNGGSDLLVGGDNNDALNGGAGNDVLRGGQNNDAIDGGAGSEDLIDFSDAAGVAGITFTLIQSGSDTTFNTPATTLLGTDTYKNIEGVIGTANADTLTGSSSNDVIRGGGGNDTLSGAVGTGDLIDFSDGTAGLTFTLVNNGAGTVFNASAAGLGTDTYSAFEGVIGTTFADSLTGSASVDQLRGGGGNDTISGLAGDDRIVGGAGADTMTGGLDNDTFVFDSAPNAVDSVTDFDASETAASEDVVELSLAVFTTLTTPSGSTLSSSEFASSNGGGAGDTVGGSIHVIYDSATGNLYYDSNGGDSTGRTLVATLTLSNPLDTFDYNDIKVGS